MWAQLLTARLQQGANHGLADLFNQLQATEEPGTGLIRSLAMQDPKNPGQVYLLAVFESEEKARAREQDPERQQALRPAKTMMADMFGGPPEFLDLDVIAEIAGQ